MDYTNDLHELCDIVSDKIAESTKKIRTSNGDLSGGDVEYLDKLTHMLKSIKTTLARIKSDSSGYMPYYGVERYNRGGSYARRDSMGRYSRRGSYGGSYDGSYDDEMIKSLRELMADSPDERTKQEFKKFIDKLERM